MIEIWALDLDGDSLSDCKKVLDGNLFWLVFEAFYFDI